MDELWLDQGIAARWSSFPIDETPRPVVLLEHRVKTQGFVDDESKQAWLQGLIQADIALPTGVLELLPRRRAGHATAVLTITEVRPVTASFRCDRGPRELPSYELQITGLTGPCVVLSPEISCWWPDESAGERFTGDNGPATIDGDDVTIHLPAVGGVLTDFHGAEFQEHDTYVVARPVTSERPVPPGTVVLMIAVTRIVTGRLATPLGNRPLLSTSGQPLEVTASR